METWTSQQLIISAVSFLALFLLCVGLLQYLRQRSRRREVVDKIKTGGSTGMAYQLSPSRNAEAAGGVRLLTALLGTVGSRLVPAKSADYASVRIRFLRAGIRRDNITAVFWGSKLLLAVCLPLMLLMARFSVLKLADLHLTLVLEVGLGLTGYYLPDLWLKIKTDLRKEKIQRALPDALDLMVVCVEAGMGMDAAIQRVTQEIKLSSPELSDELSLLNLELRAGKARQDALRNLAMRANIDAVNSLVTLLIQTDKFGTSVAAALRVFSDGFRTQRFQKAEELAAKLPVKLIIPLLLFIFPSLFVIIAGPAAIRIYQNILMR